MVDRKTVSCKYLVDLECLMLMQEQTTVKREESISQTLYIVLKRGNLSDNTVFSVK